MNKLAKLVCFIRKIVISSDLYSTRIGFTYEGDQTYKTLLGGIVSNFIRLGILIVAIILIVTIFQREKANTGINTIFKDLTNDETKHYFAKNSVYFAFKLNGPNPEKLLDPTYFNFEIQQINYQKTPDGYNAIITPIEFGYCESSFPYVQEPVYSKIGLSTYICPKNTDFFLRANFNSNNYETIQINLSKCIGTKCKSDDEINSVVNTHYMNYYLTSAYFDFNDFSNPVHTYLQDTNFADLIPNMGNFRHYKVKVNQVTTNDSIFLGSQGLTSELEFYTIGLYESFVANFQREGQKYFSFFISLDQQINKYSRSAYSFWDMLGYIGGIYGLLYSLGYIVFNLFIQRTFYSSVISNLYHVEEEPNQIEKIINKFDKTNFKNESDNIAEKKDEKIDSKYCDKRDFI